MAKQANILRRSKQAENRVQRYLWPGTRRKWKELWDIGAQGPTGEWWAVGEVKSENARDVSHAFRIAMKALEQAERVAPEDTKLVFGVWLQPRCQVKSAIVAMRAAVVLTGIRVGRIIMPMDQFRRIADDVMDFANEVADGS